MKRELRKLIEKMARANRLNTRGKREFRSEFRRAHKIQHAAVASVIAETVVGKPYNEDTLQLMLAALAETFPPVPVINFVQSVSVNGDRMMTVTLTPEAANLFAPNP